MGNNKICPNCGYNNDLNAAYCTNCGMQLGQNNVQYNVNNNGNNGNNGSVNNQVNGVDDSEGTKLGIISLLLYFVASGVIAIISSFFPYDVRNNLSAIAGVFPLAGIVVMIIGRIKYPNNKFLKIVMWVIIISIILGIIAFIVFALLVVVACTTVMESGGCH